MTGIFIKTTDSYIGNCEKMDLVCNDCFEILEQCSDIVGGCLQLIKCTHNGKHYTGFCNSNAIENGLEYNGVATIINNGLAKWQFLFGNVIIFEDCELIKFIVNSEQILQAA